MKKEEEKNNFNDNAFRSLIGDSKLTASENLQFRIMHQIEAEIALRPKKVKSSKPLLAAIVKVAIILYILIMLIGIGAYMSGGIDAIMSTDIVLSVLVMTSLASIYCLIITLDERRYRK